MRVEGRGGGGSIEWIGRCCGSKANMDWLVIVVMWYGGKVVWWYGGYQCRPRKAGLIDRDPQVQVEVQVRGRGRE